ncbi:hypothetical protein NHX12_002932 [Muraenolepis orangiensis]|uniref:Uncharacterized protein n=1 Tax=Muraenolepis orangiensis TaxID=630683 RepID=A0A9Q0DXT5_9TELE|nr:hypothetical protein NHX12_002932 [Muraenolepis orangiensis]
MENQAGFESSLRRSARLGLEVLERASRRRVDWTDSPPALGAHGDGGGPIESCSLAAEDFHIEVSPGSYSITAGLPHAHRQTQRVSLHAGDSITLTFDLSPLS